MKRYVFATIAVIVVAAGIGFWLFPDEMIQYGEQTNDFFVWLWTCIATNPFPVVIALGTFLLTVVYHKARGKSLRESLEVAATRVTVVSTPAPGPELPKEVETPVVQRARARATRTQLLTDQIGLQNRHRKLPEEILKAEKDVCYSQKELTEAKNVLTAKQKTHHDNVTRLEGLRNEKATADAELGAIDTELKKLAPMV